VLVSCPFAGMQYVSLKYVFVLSIAGHEKFTCSAILEGIKNFNIHAEETKQR
jgi:hypothetical protein